MRCMPCAGLVVPAPTYAASGTETVILDCYKCLKVAVKCLKIAENSYTHICMRTVATVRYSAWEVLP